MYKIITLLFITISNLFAGGAAAAIVGNQANLHSTTQEPSTPVMILIAVAAAGIILFVTRDKKTPEN